MGIIEFILLQFIAHLFLDYFFQTGSLAIKKNSEGFKSGFLYWHALICFILSWVVSFQLNFVFGALIIAVSHLLLDGFKKTWSRNKFVARYLFFIDQTLHIVAIVAVVFFFNRWVGIAPSWDIPFNRTFLLILTAYLLCLKPANIFIREVFRITEIEVTSDNEMPNAGKVIGVLERILALTLIIVSQYSAVGFLIAAKSILRYRSDETLKSEYVLIGTLLSFGIAVIAGILVNVIATW